MQVLFGACHVARVSRHSGLVATVCKSRAAAGTKLYIDDPLLPFQVHAGYVSLLDYTPLFQVLGGGGL